MNKEQTRATVEDIERARVLEREILNECSELLCLARFSCSGKFNHSLFRQLHRLREKMEVEAENLVSMEPEAKSQYLYSLPHRGADVLSINVAEYLLLASVGGV